MPREPVVIAVSDLPPWESGARLFAVMAYPTNATLRRRFEHAICNKLIRSAAPEWRSRSQAIRPDHALMDRDIAETVFADGMKIINEERLIAGNSAKSKWADFVRDQTGLIHPGLKVVGPTSKAMWERAWMDLDERRGTVTPGNRGNVITRSWTTSKPVIHLCVAMHYVIHGEDPDRRGLNLGDFIFDQGLTMAVIDKAAWVFAAAKQVFNIDQDEMVEVIAA